MLHSTGVARCAPARLPSRWAASERALTASGTIEGIQRDPGIGSARGGARGGGDAPDVMRLPGVVVSFAGVTVRGVASLRGGVGPRPGLAPPRPAPRESPLPPREARLGGLDRGAARASSMDAEQKVM
jgi:hypothetical protein